MLIVGSQRSEQPKNVNLEQIVRGLEIIFSNETKCKICFICLRFDCKSKYKGGGLKKCQFFLLTLKITAEFVLQGIPYVRYTFGSFFLS